MHHNHCPSCLRACLRANRYFIVFALFIAATVAGSRSRADTTAPPSTSKQSTITPQQTSPNQALADFAKEVLLKSLPPEYEKRENWDHKTEIVDGYHWEQRDGRWHFVKQTKEVNDGLWRMVKVRIDNPKKNLQLRLTTPKVVDGGRTAFTVLLTARLAVDARQEQWRLGIKGLNFHVEGDALVEARLDMIVGFQPVTGGSFGAVEVQPEVTGVGLRLVDLTLKKIDLLHGDAAKELGHAFEDILAGELHKKEPEIAKKINEEIKRHPEKLRFSPAQILEIGWDKIGALFGGGASEKEKPAAKN